MSKEFEALLDLKEKHYRGYLTNDEYIEKVNEVLSNYVNDYNNANPSEALKCLKGINNYLNNVYDYKEIKEEIQKDINTIKQALLKAQEQEKVLKLIKSKKYIPLDKINPRFWNDKGVYEEMVNYEYYLWLCKNECEYVVREERKLTQDEFNSIKEMFKYIKKDNNIYEVEIKDNFVFWKEEKDGITFELRISIDGAKENYRCADTPQELCDEFVLYDNHFNTYGVFDKKVIDYKWLQNHIEIYKGMTIYGAIWTDKGLIYVAKMNSKGELEFI